MFDIDINEYDYGLPEELIAQYPLETRDSSRLLIDMGSAIKEDVFSNIAGHLPAGSMLLFNNSRVIHARLLFKKDSGASIEVLCLEPIAPGNYEESFSSTSPVTWKCIVGNLKKWKSGKLSLTFEANSVECILSAEKIRCGIDTCEIRFEWSGPASSFGEVVESAGHMPLPPYIERPDEEIDNERYQTIYSSVRGSVAAPTAGLHFTDSVMEELRIKNISKAEVTLHVGAGTFQPVKSRFISGHEMHREHFSVTKDTLERLIQNTGNIIPVGTTSLRTLESLYWLGLKVKDRTAYITDLTVDQWEPYSKEANLEASDSLKALLDYLNNTREMVLQASTSLIIVPGYKFRLTNGLVTNFHQPKSTLLLLVSAWSGIRWKEIYRYAVDHRFRFLSYGDSSLLLK